MSQVGIPVGKYPGPCTAWDARGADIAWFKQWLPEQAPGFNLHFVDVAYEVVTLNMMAGAPDRARR